MKKLNLLLGTLLATVALSHAVDSYSEIVGYTTTSVAPGKMTMASFPLLKAEVYSGVFSSKNGAVLNSAGSSFNSTLLASKNYAGESLYYVEIASTGASSGLILDIVSAASTSVTVAAPDAARLTGTENYKIRKYLTLADVFGPGNEVGLKQGPSINEADIVYALVNGNWKQYYYYDDQVGFDPTQWNDLSMVGDASDARIDPDQGLLIARKAGSNDVQLKIAGTVKSTDAKIPVAAGMQMVTNPWPTPMTFSQLGLKTTDGDVAKGLQQGPSVAESDVVYRLENGVWQQYYIYDDQVGFDPVSWNKLGSVDDQANTQIGVGEAILIKRVASQAFEWKPSKNF